MQVEAPLLPLGRVRNAVAFEMMGVNFAGSYFLKSEVKDMFIYVCSLTSSSFAINNFYINR